MFDPIGKIMEIYEAKYPDNRIMLAWCSDLADTVRSDGLCMSPGGGNKDPDAPHMIFVDPKVSVAEAARILIHELAHTVVPANCGDAHGEAFDAVVRELTVDYAPTAADFGLPVMVENATARLDDPEEQEAWDIAVGALSRAMWTSSVPVTSKGGEATRAGSADDFRSSAESTLACLLHDGFFVFGNAEPAA